MTTAAFGGSPFSTAVKLWLETEHGTVPLSHVGPESVIAREAIQLPPCSGVLVVSIDGELQRREVILDQGMQPDVTITPIQMSDHASV